MGTDDLFHKRKARQAESHRRKSARRQPYERILLVCEGQKTEPYYFGGLRRALRLNPANVVIADKKHGLDPKGLVEYALKELRKNPDFNHVYCIFDRDKHTTFEAALSKVRDTKLTGGAKLHAITSVPCFEIWVLLHFCYTTRSFQAGGNDSNCALVVAELRKADRIPNYEKGANGIFALLSSRVETAMANARRLTLDQENSGTDNPSTRVHKLVEHLFSLQQEQET